MSKYKRERLNIRHKIKLESGFLEAVCVFLRTIAELPVDSDEPFSYGVDNDDRISFADYDNLQVFY